MRMELRKSAEEKVYAGDSTPLWRAKVWGSARAQSLVGGRLDGEASVVFMVALAFFERLGYFGFGFRVR